MPKSYDGAEFAKALSDATFREPIVLTGMAKQAEDDPKAVMFAEGTLCQSWVKIPVEMIDTVEYLAISRCRDHDHPMVTLSLKEPPPENPIARMLADLLRKAQPGMRTSPGWQRTSGQVMFKQGGSGSGAGSGSGSHGCVYIPIIKLHRPPTGPEGYPADPGWVQEIEFIEVCW